MHGAGGVYGTARDSAVGTIAIAASIIFALVIVMVCTSLALAVVNA